MKGKANVVCPKCKHCEGLDRLTKMYSCKHYNNYPDSAIGMDCEIECDNFEEVNMNKVEGKVGDVCLNCKNCKGITKEHDGKNASIKITEVECVDPYDGMTKTLNVNSNICCSMFEPKKEKNRLISTCRAELFQKRNTTSSKRAVTVGGNVTTRFVTLYAKTRHWMSLSLVLIFLLTLK